MTSGLDLDGDSRCGQVQENGLFGDQQDPSRAAWSLFWHFLDVVWICVFTVVYLLGTM